MGLIIDENALKVFGTNLKEARDQKKLTQEDIAKDAGITTSYYARIERGEENPTFAVIQNICKVLKIKSSDVLPF